MDWKKFHSFMNFASFKVGRSRVILWVEALKDSLVYNISLLEYFQFGFYKNISSNEKERWAGTGYMYEYQKIMNPVSKRQILDDKTLFYQEYKSYFKHHVVSLKELEKDLSLAEIVLREEKVVLKESKGKCGLGTAFFNSDDFTAESLLNKMKLKGFDLAETFIQQHKDLNRLSPSGVNTVRIFTQLTENEEVIILGCRQRISVNSPVDNLAAGNLAASVNDKTGTIDGPGVYSDITKEDQKIHPVTKVLIEGFQVPFWDECLDLVKRAALAHPENRSIGWDVIVTEEGPGLLEGNHDWCKLVWQLPVKKGLKPILENHLKAYTAR